MSSSRSRSTATRCSRRLTVFLAAALFAAAVPAAALTSTATAARPVKAATGATPKAPAKRATSPTGARAAQDGPAGVTARAGIVIDDETGQVLWARAAGQPREIASTTKILTALVVVAAGDLDKVVTIEATPALDSGTIGLGPSDHLTRRQLLYAMLLPSANDAAYVLAQDVGGSQQGFVQRMNEYARKLGTRGVHMDNPHGLPDVRHTATAAALARWTQALLADPVLARIVHTKFYRLPGFGRLSNTNWLLWSDPRVIGVKTGYTDAAGYCLVAAAKGPYGTPIAVVLGEEVDAARFRDAEKLLRWAYSRYQPRPLVDRGKVYAIPQVPAWNGLPVPLVPESRPTTVVVQGATLRTEVVSPQVIEPPVRRGQELGYVRVWQGQRVLGTVPLVAGSSVRRPTYLESLRLFALNPMSIAQKIDLLWQRRSLLTDHVANGLGHELSVLTRPGWAFAH